MLEIQKIRKDINWLIEQIKCLIKKSDLDCPLAATEWSPNHSVALGNPYILDCFVWLNGHVYRSLIDNNIYPPTNDCYWEDLGEGHLLLEEQSNWNATTGRAFIPNKPTNTSDFTNDGEDGSSPFATLNDLSAAIPLAQDLYSVLTEGDTAEDKQVNVESVGLWDNFTAPFGFARITADKSRINFISKLGNSMLWIAEGSFALIKGVFTFTFNTQTLTSNRIATFQNASGVVAYLSDLSQYAIDSNVVHKTGDETIDGIKIFIKDIIVNSVFVGRGEGGHITNTALGYRVLLHNTTGVENTAIGSQALRNNIAGIRNTAVGEGSLKQNLANENTAIGHGSLQVNTTGIENTAVGALALNSNIIGEGNTAVGLKALKDNVASNNTAVGKEALRENKTGYNNTVIGSLALSENTNGFDNVAIGTDALRNASSNSKNTAVGKSAMGDGASPGGYNTAVGASALQQADDNSLYNTGVGVYALYNVRGDFNTALGYNALSGVTTGSKNVGIGAYALASNFNGQYNIAIGYAALDQENSGEDNIGIGRDCRIIGINASNCIVIGADARGLGSNTTVIGNNFTTLTELRGDLSLPEVKNLDFVDDAAAALGGVPIDAIYHNAGILRIRLV